MRNRRFRLPVDRITFRRAALVAIRFRACEFVWLVVHGFSLAQAQADSLPLPASAQPALPPAGNPHLNALEQPVKDNNTAAYPEAYFGKAVH